MPAPFDKWTVLPHGPIGTIDDNILMVEGFLGKFPRRMTVVRLRGQRSVIYSGIALDEAEMARLESFGKPGFYIVPSALHRMEVKPWKQRYPAITIACPPGARSKVEELVKVDTTAPDFDDPAVRCEIVEGTDGRECALVVEGSQGTSLVLNDLVFNVRRQPGLFGLIFQIVGVTGPEPKMPKLVMRKLVHDKNALRAQLTRWANLRDLRRIIPSHGAIVEADPRGTLLGFAASLA